MNNQSEMTPHTQGSVKCAQKEDIAQKNEYKMRYADRYRRLFPFIIAASAAYTVLVYRSAAGIGNLIFILLLIALQVCIALKVNPAERLSRRTNMLMALMAVLGVHLCTTASYPLIAADICLAVFVFLLTVLSLYRKDDGNTARLLKNLVKVLFTPLEHLPDVFTGLSFLFPQKGKEDADKARRTAGSVFLGLLILAVLLLIIVPLLVSADLMFAELWDNLFSFHFDSETVPVHINMFLAAFIVLTALWVYMPLDPEPAAKQEKTMRKKPAPVAAVTYLAPISVIYLIFTIISVRYILIGGSLPEGVTYAEYVHQGFYQLLAVTIINLILIAVTKTVFDENRTIRFLLCLLCALTYGIIWNGSYRMILYIEAYQLTFLRLAVCFFYLLLAIFITFLLITLLRGSFPLVRASAAAAIMIYLVFAYMHPDAVIARYNMQSAEPDAAYLSCLSMDAVPVLAENPDLLEECGMTDSSYSEYSPDSIFQYNFSEARAKKIIKELQDRRMKSSGKRRSDSRKSGIVNISGISQN